MNTEAVLQKFLSNEESYQKKEVMRLARLIVSECEDVIKRVESGKRVYESHSTMTEQYKAALTKLAFLQNMKKPENREKGK